MDTEIPITDLTQMPKYSWLVRPCEHYKEEYSDCTSIKARFHQYFIHGETQDCTQWKRDFENCMNYRKKKDESCLNNVIDSERERRQKRLEGHYKNDVWEKRDSPPESWNEPLPEWLEKQNEVSYLTLKKKELQEGKNFPEKGGFCVIS